MTQATNILKQVLSATCLIMACLFSLSFIYIALSTLNYPFNLEWMEGHTLDIISRIHDGKQIYAKPSLAYVPYLYTPLYFHISSLVASFTGVDFLAPRLVSFLSTIGSTFILYLWVKRVGGKSIYAFIAAGLFLATYRLSGRWFDLARVDSLYLFLMIWGLYLFYFAQSKKVAVFSGVLFAAAFFTKQSAIIALLPAFFAALFIKQRLAFIAAGVGAFTMFIGCAYLQNVSNGWFSFYAYDVGAGHRNNMPQLVTFWTKDLLRHCAVMLLLSFSAIYLIFKYQDKREWLWYGAMAMGFIGSAYISRIHSFGHINVLMPAHYIMALLCGIALHHFRGKAALIRIIILSAIVFQFSSMHYNPMKSIPEEGAIEKGNLFLKEIKKIPGDILFSELQYIQTHAGKTPYSIGMAGFDIIRSDLKDKKHIRREFLDELKDGIKNRRFSAVITGRFIKIRELKGNYRFDQTIDPPQEYVTGAVRSTKALVYLPLPVKEKFMLPSELQGIIND